MAQTGLSRCIKSGARLFHVSCRITNAIAIEAGHFIRSLLQRHTVTRSFYIDCIIRTKLWYKIIFRATINVFNELSTAIVDVAIIL